ncbi:MAG: FAD-dependent oxidoreductase [Alphaproteobacteria bacterium]|nr:FAD-dependent oxidoreductase [Alphaproteobacteria bacterium]
MTAPVASRRLTGPGIVRTGEPVIFSFDGDTIKAVAGETVAAALIAAGRNAQRRTATKAPRGLFCGIGVCQECLVEVDGKTGQRACMTTVTPGMEVRTHRHAAWTDAVGDGLKPLAPYPSGAIPATPADLVVIGAGPAGLAAALAAARRGTKVVVVDERSIAGGQFYKQLGTSHRFLDDAAPDPQFSDGAKLIAATDAAGVEFRLANTVWHAARESDGSLTLGLYDGTGASLIHPRALILATGAYEIPSLIEGWTLPGVMTTGAAQTLLRSYRVAPGDRVLIAGNGPLNWQLAAELSGLGVSVVALVESAKPERLDAVTDVTRAFATAPGLMLKGLGYRAALRRAGVPLLTGHAVTALRGDGHVEEAVVNALDKPGQPRHFAVDAVCLGYGLAPSLELARLLGCRYSVDQTTGQPVAERTDSGVSSQPNIWIAGDGGGMGGSVAALAQGQLAGLEANRFLTNGDDRAERLPEEVAARRNLARARRFQAALWRLFRPVAPQPSAPDSVIVCRCEDVTARDIQDRITEGVTDLGSLKRVTRLGMGRCQGRYCSGMAARMLVGRLNRRIEPFDLFAPQNPVKPVPAAALLVEKPEWGGHREVEASRPPTSIADARPLPEACDLLVIGAGIIGASTAMYAAGAGLDTLVIDRNSPNSQASGGNAGSLHVQLLSWDFGVKAMAGGTPALLTLPLQRDAVTLWREIEATLGSDFEIAITGGLMVAENEADAVYLEQKVAAERSVGVETEVIGRSDLKSLAPFISDRMVVAAYCPGEGKINPLKGTPAIVAEACRRGARFASGVEVVGIERDGNAWIAITAGGARIRTEKLVIAAGGWSAQLGRMIGVPIPVQGAPLQMLVTEPAPPIVKQLVAHADRHLTMKQASNGNLIIGGAWTAGDDPITGRARILRDSIEGNLWVAERTVPAVGGLHLIRSWAAMNVNIDGAPLLGALPGCPGAFIAATANGYTLGPLMGKLTAELVTEGRNERDLSPFGMARFA